jgi:Bacteriophage clamp loader A subunit
MDLFKECLPSLLEKNEYLIETEEDEKSYSPFMVNKSLSAHIDCILHANAMNLNHQLDKKLQYDYLFHSIRKYKRKYQKWMKFNETKDISLVKEYYQCNANIAKDYLRILSKDQLKTIEEKLDKGGKYK